MLGYDVTNTKGENFYVTPPPSPSTPPSLVCLLHTPKEAGLWRYIHLILLSVRSKILASSSVRINITDKSFFNVYFCPPRTVQRCASILALVMLYVKVAPACAIMISSYEACKTFFKSRNLEAETRDNTAL